MRPIFFGLFVGLLLNLGAGGQSKSPATSGDTTVAVSAAKMEIHPLPPESLQRVAAFHESLQPSAKAWIEQQARIEARRSTPDLNALRGAIRQRFAGSHPDNAAVDSVASLVLLQMAQDRDANLRAQMAQVHALNQQKQDSRRLPINLAMKWFLRERVSAPEPARALFACRFLPDSLN